MSAKMIQPSQWLRRMRGMFAKSGEILSHLGSGSGVSCSIGMFIVRARSSRKMISISSLRWYCVRVVTSLSGEMTA